MRIALDMDGCLSNFWDAFEDKIVQVVGKDRFPLRAYGQPPAVWNWVEEAGYDDWDIRQAWMEIFKSPDFWVNLAPLPDAVTAAVLDKQPNIEMYVITNREGRKSDVRNQTQRWLLKNGIYKATVLVSGEKGALCRALEIEWLLDDCVQYCVDVAANAPYTKVYMLRRPYNKGLHYDKVIPVHSLAEVCEWEDILTPREKAA